MQDLGFPGGAVVKNLAADAINMCLIPNSRRFTGGGNGNPLQYYCLEIPQTHGVAKSRSWLSKWTCTHACKSYFCRSPRMEVTESVSGVPETEWEWRALDVLDPERHGTRMRNYAVLSNRSPKSSHWGRCFEPSALIGVQAASWVWVRASLCCLLQDNEQQAFLI